MSLWFGLVWSGLVWFGLNRFGARAVQPETNFVPLRFARATARVQAFVTTANQQTLFVGTIPVFNLFFFLHNALLRCLHGPCGRTPDSDP